MRKTLPCLLSVALLGWMSLPAWAQLGPPLLPPSPPPQQAPAPVQIAPLASPDKPGKPAEQPPPPPPTTPPTTTPGGYIAPDYLNSNCCEQQQRSFWSGTWSVDGGAYYLVPFFSSSPALFTRNGGGSTNQHDFGVNGNAAPTADLSYTLDSGLGIAAHWFSFNSSSSTAQGLAAGTGVMDAGGYSLGTASPAGANANATSNLEMFVIDLEITQKWYCGTSWWLQLGGGVRYAHVDESYQLTVNDRLSGNSTSIANHGFTGWGPTASFEFHRRVCDSGFGLYGSVRGSLLFTATDQNYAVTSTNAAVASTFGSGNSYGIIPVGEAELGVEYGYNWGNRLRVYGQLGAVGQIWGGGGSAAEGAGLAPGSLATQSNSPANFGFIGGVARIGFSF